MTAYKHQAIDEAFAAEDWSAAGELLRAALKAAPHDHWLLTRMATTYYEQRKYAAALKWSQAALAQSPTCPLVLWDYAGALDMLGREDEAIVVWQSLIDRGPEAIAAERCSVGIRSARSLVNDCRYRVACCLADLGRLTAARIVLQQHLAARNRQCPSIYSRQDVTARLADWNAPKDKPRSIRRPQAASA